MVKIHSFFSNNWWELNPKDHTDYKVIFEIDKSCIGSYSLKNKEYIECNLDKLRSITYDCEDIRTYKFLYKIIKNIPTVCAVKCLFYNEL